MIIDSLVSARRCEKICLPPLTRSDFVIVPIIMAAFLDQAMIDGRGQM